VSSGTPSSPAIRRCPRPRAAAASAAPITGASSGRRSSSRAGSSTCVFPQPAHRDRRGLPATRTRANPARSAPMTPTGPYTLTLNVAERAVSARPSPCLTGQSPAANKRWAQITQRRGNTGKDCGKLASKISKGVAAQQPVRRDTRAVALTPDWRPHRRISARTTEQGRSREVAMSWRDASETAMVPSQVGSQILRWLLLGTSSNQSRCHGNG
jgi:hypothetical protein